jgi:exonuclease III
LKPDITILTETNLLPDSNPIFPPFSNSESGYHCIWGSSTYRGTGFGVILGPDCQVIGKPSINSDGRKIEVSLLYQQSVTLHLVAVYVPATPSDRSRWIHENLIEAESSLPRIDILAGDFNCILSPHDIDSPNYNIVQTIAKAFKSFNRLHNLIDIIATNNRFTFTHPSSGHQF